MEKILGIKVGSSVVGNSDGANVGLEKVGKDVGSEMVGNFVGISVGVEVVGLSEGDCDGALG